MWRRDRGSSPRVRGKSREEDPRRPRRGLIPARAGKIPIGTRTSASTSAHPRACGENFQHCSFPFMRVGSSPRVRGKSEVRAAPRRGQRLIPARAGKMWSRADAATLARAHPRACGENGGPGPSAPRPWGSSPRVRGKSHRPGLRPRRNRLIPARAGKMLPDLGFYRSGRSDLGNPRAFLLFWKLLIPGRPRKRRAASGASAGSVYWPRPWATAGRIMSRMPSKSTGRQGSPQVRNSRPCSLRAL